MEGVSIDELDDHILLLEAAQPCLDLEWSESLGVFEERLGYQVHGYPSLVPYLKDRARMGASRAHEYSWADGGETTVTNLCLLGRYHRTLIHRHQDDPNQVLDLATLQPSVGHRPN